MASELTGTIQKVIYCANDFVIAALRDGPVVKGAAAQGDLKPELSYRFWGKEVDNPTYGKQFEFRNFALDRPHDQQGVMAYLSKIADGVGIMTAGRLWDAFGHEAIDVLVKEPQRAVDAGCCTAKVADRAHQSLKLRVADQRTRVDLLDIFGNLGFPGALIPRLIDKWGVAAPQIVRERPFRLLLEELPGCGFKRVDLLHTQLGHPYTSPDRQKVCAWHKVHGNNDGSTWLRESDVVAKLTEELGGDSDPDYAISQAVESKLLARQQLGQDAWLAVPRKADAEGVIVRSMARLLSARPTIWPAIDSLTVLTDHQREVLGPTLDHAVVVLTGTPGTGKTFAASQIVKYVTSLVPPDEIAVCAPTGKAAVRITQAMNEYGVNVEATTIHRLLRICGGTRDGFLFTHNRDYPLPHRLIVVDEMSMSDVDLFAALLDALEPGTHVLLVGDPYQLPPVGHGAPLRDLLDSGVLPRGELTEIRRNSGLIVKACRSIKDGYRYETCESFDDGENNFRSLEAPDAVQALAFVRGLCRKFVERVKSGELARYDPIEDIQVLCVVNEKSELGRYNLNRILQEELNPRGEGGDAHPFRVGDKVICTLNGKRPTMVKTPGEPDNLFDAWFKTSDQEREKYIANGDMGRVLAISPSCLIVRFSNPERFVLINLPKGKRAQGDEGEESGSQGSVDLGYAITVHKSQGSDWPFVLIPLDESERAASVACRELLYTAISRAKWRCLLVGRRAVADQWCQTVTLKKRKTLLKERLVAALGKLKLGLLSK